MLPPFLAAFAHTAAIPPESSATRIAGQKRMLSNSLSDASNKAETSMKLPHYVSIHRISNLTNYEAIDPVSQSAMRFFQCALQLMALRFNWHTFHVYFPFLGEMFQFPAFPPVASITARARENVSVGSLLGCHLYTSNYCSRA